MLVGSLGRGTLVFSSGFVLTGADTLPEGIHAFPASYYRVAEGREPVETWTMLGIELGVTGDRGRPSSPSPPIFTRQGGVVFGSDRAVTTDTRMPEFRFYDGTGRLDRIVRHSAPARLVTPELIEEYVAFRLEGVTDPVERATRAEALRARPAPDTLPYHASVVLDRPEGNLWVRDYALPWESSRDWTVFATDGTQLTRVSIPAALLVYEIGGDYLLGKLTDELGIERVVVYALIKPE
jgi:hypothetical protein